MTASEEGQPGGPVRRTPRQAATVEGLGLFTGVHTRVTIRPSEGEEGIIFRRVDLGSGVPGHPAPTVRATIGNVVSEQRRTVLQADVDPAPGGGDTSGAVGGVRAGGCRVETVEHILSALAGLGVTDAIIDVDGPEIPIGDGSALPFVEALAAAGNVMIGPALAAPVRIVHPLTVSEKGGQVDVFPLGGGDGDAGADGCEYIYRLDFGPDSPIAAHEARFFLPCAGDAKAYIARVARARTFSTLDQAQLMRRMGLFTQFTPRDLLVIGPDGPIDNALRFADEPAMHKLLDMMGDLFLSGRRIIGRVVATRSGHALNHEMARALASLP